MTDLNTIISLAMTAHENPEDPKVAEAKKAFDEIIEIEGKELFKEEQEPIPEEKSTSDVLKRYSEFRKEFYDKMVAINKILDKSEMKDNVPEEKSTSDILKSFSEFRKEFDDKIVAINKTLNEAADYVNDDNVFQKLKVKKLTESAIIPTKGSSKAAGYDLYADQDIIVTKNFRALVSTGISVAIPEGYYGRIAPRSGLAYKNGIDIGAGVIDSDYRGEVKVIIMNITDLLNGDSSKEYEFAINKGDRIAQLIFEKIGLFDIVETENLDETVRGEGGFGSTGIN